MEREELISTALRIAEIRAELARMSQLQDELHRLEFLLDTLSVAKQDGSVRRRRSKETIEDRILQFLQEHAESDFDGEAVGAALGVKIPTARAAFSKLRSSGKITDTTRGRVQFKKPPSGDLKEIKEEDSASRIAA